MGITLSCYILKCMSSVLPQILAPEGCGTAGTTGVTPGPGGMGGVGSRAGPGGAALGPRSSNVMRLLGAGLLEKELLDNGGLLSSSLVVATAVAPAVRTVSIDEDDIADMFHLKTIWRGNVP